MNDHEGYNPQEAPTIPPVITTEGKTVPFTANAPLPLEERIAVALEQCAAALTRIAQHCDTGMQMQDAATGRTGAVSLGGAIALIAHHLSQQGQRIVAPGPRRY